MRYCSLGTYCQTAEWLIRNNLKEASTPFDWMFSSFAMIQHCIEDDFKSFLDKSQYYVIENNHTDHRVCGHHLYRPFIDFTGQLVIGAVFPHHDPLRNQEDYEHYERTINRFRELIKSDEKKMFFIFYKHFNFKDVNDAVLQSLLFTQFLDKHVQNYKLIVVYTEVGDFKYSIINGHNLHFINIRAAITNGQRFESEHDNIQLDNIIKKLIDDFR